MNRYLTELNAYVPSTGEYMTFAGPVIVELTATRAQKYCNDKMPFLTVVGKVKKIIRDDGQIVEDYTFKDN